MTQRRIAIVTGGASGIGEAISRRPSKDGFHVAVVDIDGEGCERLANEVGGSAHRVDVSDSRQVSTAYEAIAELGTVEALVNCAGIGGGSETEHSFEITMAQLAEAGAGGPVVTLMDTTIVMTDEQWRRMLGVHLDGTFFWTRAVLRAMADQRSGSIVNISSIDGMIGASGLSHYSAAKAGILGFTRSVAREVGAVNVRVNAVAPGFVDTPVFRRFINPTVQSVLEAQTPMARVAEPSEIAGMVSFLVSDDASFVTGQTMSPNGGMVTT